MTSVVVSARNLAVLKSPAFDLPKARSAGRFDDFLEETYTAFFKALLHLDDPVASQLRARSDRMHSLATVLLKAWRLGRRGEWADADVELDKGLQSVREDLIRLSRRHSAQVLQGQSWYRLAAWKGVESRQHMFHTPFELEMSHKSIDETVGASGRTAVVVEQPA